VTAEAAEKQANALKLHKIEVASDAEMHRQAMVELKAELSESVEASTHALDVHKAEALCEFETHQRTLLSCREEAAAESERFEEQIAGFMHSKISEDVAKEIIRAAINPVTEELTSIASSCHMLSLESAKKQEVCTLAHFNEYKSTAMCKLDAVKTVCDTIDAARQQDLECLRVAFTDHKAASQSKIDAALEAQGKAFEDYKIDAQEQFADLEAELVFRLRKSGQIDMQYSRTNSRSGLLTEDGRNMPRARPASKLDPIAR